MNKYLMHKSDFTVDGWSDYVANKQNTHVTIDFDQMIYVNKNPKVNGPKLLHFLLTSQGMADDIKNRAFVEIVRAEQARQDNGAKSYAEETKKDEPNAVEQVQELAPEVPVTPVMNDAIVETMKTLDSMPDKDELVKYAENTLGIKVKVPGRAGRDRVLATIKAKLLAPESEIAVVADGE